MDLRAILAQLAQTRPIFHSEADFQHALAQQILVEHPDCNFVLERRVPGAEGDIYLDAWLVVQDQVIAVELKYRTQTLTVEVGRETFALKDHSAQDIGRREFWEDVERLERVLQEGVAQVGYAAFLTNDSTFWRDPGSRRASDADFRMYEGRVVEGVLKWGSTAGPGTTEGREKPIKLAGSYELRWEDYSQPSQEKHGQFRYLLLEVSPPRSRRPTSPQ